VFAYLLDCLFAERKDRSILFWKSLPVSDAETVLVKLFVALVLAPAGAILLTLVLQPILGLIVYLGVESLRGSMGLDVFSSWPAILPRIGVIWAFSTLWYAPLACYLMLASVLAPRTPLVFAVVPPLMLSVLERTTLSTSYIGQFLLERLVPGRKLDRGLMLAEGSDSSSIGEWVQPFLLPELWLGLAAAAGMLYIIIRLRRFRDDT
jgi:ABC-2 type transport system permease protein